MYKYKKVRKIGQGGFGRIYIVADTTSDPPVQYVMKEIDLLAFNANGKSEDQAKADALAEVQFLNQLKQHPNITQVLEVFEDSAMKQMYIVMEYCVGGDLDAQIQQSRAQNLAFTEEQILSWFAQICLAIRHCHERNILHRDIKTPNIFLTADLQIKVGDFGIAHALESTFAQAQTQIGTPAYYSPELCAGLKYDAKGDVWALGIVLYELMCLRRPFEANNVANLAERIVNRPPAEMPPHTQAYSPQLRALCLQLLDKNPARRPRVSEILALPFIQPIAKRIIERQTKQYRCLSCRKLFSVHASTPGGTIVACPGCRAFNKVPDAKSIEIQSSNPLGGPPVASAAPASAEEQMTPAPPPPESCQECEEPQAECRAWCGACEQWLCLYCDTKIHGKARRAAHYRVFLQDEFEDRNRSNSSSSSEENGSGRPIEPENLPAAGQGEDEHKSDGGSPLLKTFRAGDLQPLARPQFAPPPLRPLGLDGAPLPMRTRRLSENLSGLSLAEAQGTGQEFSPAEAAEQHQPRPPRPAAKPPARGSSSLPPGFAAVPQPPGPASPGGKVRIVSKPGRLSSDSPKYPCFPFSNSNPNQPQQQQQEVGHRRHQSESAESSADGSAPEVIRFNCYLCQEQLRVAAPAPDAGSAGTVVKCTGCKELIHVPIQQVSPPPPASRYPVLGKLPSPASPGRSPAAAAQFGPAILAAKLSWFASGRPPLTYWFGFDGRTLACWSRSEDQEAGQDPLRQWPMRLLVSLEAGNPQFPGSFSAVFNSDIGPQMEETLHLQPSSGDGEELRLWVDSLRQAKPGVPARR